MSIDKVEYELYNVANPTGEEADAMAKRNGRMMMREGMCMSMCSGFPCVRRRM